MPTLIPVVLDVSTGESKHRELAPGEKIDAAYLPDAPPAVGAVGQRCFTTCTYTSGVTAPPAQYNTLYAPVQLPMFDGAPADIVTAHYTIKAGTNEIIFTPMHLLVEMPINLSATVTVGGRISGGVRLISDAALASATISAGGGDTLNVYNAPSVSTEALFSSYGGWSNAVPVGYNCILSNTLAVEILPTHTLAQRTFRLYIDLRTTGLGNGANGGFSVNSTVGGLSVVGMLTTTAV